MPRTPRALRGAIALLAAAAAAVLPAPALAARKPPPPVGHKVATINGLTVDRYTWRDSRGRPRTVSLVQPGQAGGGGYAIRMTYQIKVGGKWRVVRADAPGGRGDAGFGYVVSHEAYRTFDGNACPDGTNSCPIAALHGEDDSPLGRYLQMDGAAGPRTRNRAAHVFHVIYPHWGTDPGLGLEDPTGGVTPIDPVWHKRYEIPVTVRWVFQNGWDDPRWTAIWDFSDVPPNTVSVDVRGPYGVIDWTGGAGTPVSRIEWADSHRFHTTGAAATTGSGWTWSAPNTPGARYVALVAGRYAMGLVDMKPYGKSRTGSTWADARGKTSATHPGCTDAGWTMPCDWQWTYQSIQYEDFKGSPSTERKLAWGSAAYVGQTRTTDDDGEPFSGYPIVKYTVRIVLEATGGKRIRRLAAAAG